MEGENDLVHEGTSSILTSLFWKVLYLQYYVILFVGPIYILLIAAGLFNLLSEYLLGMNTEKIKREKPSDEVLLNAHNKICSSTDVEEAKKVIAEYPEALSYKVMDWGGSNTLHTICSRQPNNFKLIKLLVDEGLKQNVGGAPHAKGGLIVRDYFDRTPLNMLVENNAISTLRRLMQCDPPLVVPYDVVDSRLFNSVHSTYHVDMFRFLVNLNPETISKKQIFHKNMILLDYMIDRSSAHCVRFLLRILPIMIEEGIRQNLGGEYGGGGLFVNTTGGRNCPADFLVGIKRFSWKIIGPIIGGTIQPVNNDGTSSPILHGAIMMKLKNGDVLNCRHVKGICQYVEHAASVRDSKGRMPIHVGAALGLQWDDRNGGMSDVVKANVLGAKMRDPVTGLPVHALAAVGKYSLSSVYHLILLGGLDDFCRT